MLLMADEKTANPGDEKQFLEADAGTRMASNDTAGQSSLQKIFTRTTEILLNWGVETHG
jgi:hypothetical protein